MTENYKFMLGNFTYHILQKFEFWFWKHWRGLIVLNNIKLKCIWKYSFNIDSVYSIDSTFPHKGYVTKKQKYGDSD